VELDIEIILGGKHEENVYNIGVGGIFGHICGYAYLVLSYLQNSSDDTCFRVDVVLVLGLRPSWGVCENIDDHSGGYE
jgi:hypothetical protein